MASKILKMLVRIAADDDLTPALSRLRRSSIKTFKSIGRSSLRLTKSIAKIGTVGAIAAASGIAKLTLDYAEQADVLDKFSKQTGMGVLALQEIAHAAELAGIEIPVLYKSFEKLSRNIGDARQGQGEMVTILKKAAPALLEELKAVKSTEEGFDLMVDALHAIPDEADKASLAQAVFGRAGQKIIRITHGGTKELEKYRAEARKYGLITKEQTEQAALFKDEQHRLFMALEGVRNAVAGPLLKAMTPYVTKMQEWVVANREIVSSKIIKVIGDMASGIGGVDFESLANDAGDFAMVLGDIASAMKTIFDIATDPRSPFALGFNLAAIAGVTEGRIDEEREQRRLAAVAKLRGVTLNTGGEFRTGSNISIRRTPQPARLPISQGANDARSLLASEVTINLNAPAGTTVESIQASPGAKVAMKGGRRKPGGGR